MPLHDQHPIPPIVSLRRYGDIIGILPLVYSIHKKRNEAIPMVVHRSFADVLEGVSYVKPLIWDSDMENPLAACRIFRGVNAQVVGRGLNPDRKLDFARQAWMQLGYTWNRHAPLVFDKRDSKREEKLSKVFKTDLPKILVKLHSYSSPFSDAVQFKKLLSEFQGLAEVVYLDAIHAERVYDLLGLMDKAACLISADTVPLWLAKATKCPVIALVNPTPFLGSPESGNVLLRIPYNRIMAEWDNIARAVLSTLFHHDNDDIVLVFNDFKTTDPDTQRRQREARATWRNLDCRLLPFKAARTSASLGDRFISPYIRDMIQAAIESGKEGIIAISNTDIQFLPGLQQEIVRSCRQYGCFWSYRISGPNKQTDYGADVFAFTRSWWFEHEHLYPDLLLGYYHWDDLMIRMMRWCGRTECGRFYSHESHPGSTHRIQTPGGQYNQRTALAWLEKHYEVNVRPEP
jgi:hypothetical protein